MTEFPSHSDDFPIKSSSTKLSSPNAAGVRGTHASLPVVWQILRRRERNPRINSAIVCQGAPVATEGCCAGPSTGVPWRVGPEIIPENVLLPSGKENRVQEKQEKSLVAGNIFSRKDAVYFFNL